MTGRCFSLTCLPLRQPRRISKLVSSAGVHSAPKAPSTGLAGFPHSREATPIQFPGDAARVAAFLPDRREPCGSVRHPTGGRCRTFIPLTKHDQLGGDLLREGAQRLPGVGLRHGSQHEGSHDREVVKACREFGNVCRVFGN